MAKGKKKSSKHYISKGQRPNVSAYTRKLVRKFRFLNRPIEDVLKSMTHIDRVIAKPFNKKEKELKERYLEQRMVESKCYEVMNRFSKAGLTRAATIMAIKTDQIPELINKWKPRMAAFVAQEKINQKKLENLKLSGSRISK